jgi:hypothetical protein
MTSFGGGLTPQGNASNALWTLNMNSVLQSCAPTATNQQGCDPVWTNATPGVAPPGGQINFINYDPNIGQVWGIYGTNSIWLYNPANNTYSKHGSLSTGYHNFSVLDPLHKLFITAGSDGIHYFDVSNPANTNITFQSPTVTGCSLLTGGSAGTNGQYPGMVWDPVAQQVIAYPNGGNALVILDPTTWTCTTETYGSRQGTDYPQNTIILSGVSGTFGHFQYIPAYDIFDKHVGSELAAAPACGPRFGCGNERARSAAPSRSGRDIQALEKSDRRRRAAIHIIAAQRHFGKARERLIVGSSQETGSAFVIAEYFGDVCAVIVIAGVGPQRAAQRIPVTGIVLRSLRDSHGGPPSPADSKPFKRRRKVIARVAAACYAPPPCPLP